ncbi:MAG TPA: hypothetical protein VK399_19485 [Longimicrobiaceae bacterium]|nr:hypothetical protein [Longimicrobiaceae bacterium]
MAENDTPQNRLDDELDVEELDEVAGGAGTNNCDCTNNWTLADPV